SLGGDAHVTFVVDSQLCQTSLPSLFVGKVRRPLTEFVDQRRRQLLSSPIVLGRVVDGVNALISLQNLQEVEPTLAGRALEVSEPLVADGGTVTIVAVVAGTGVVHADVGGDRQARLEHLG